MPLKKSKGNMYPDVITKNFIKGICPHQCSYCYMRERWSRMKPPRLVESEFRENLYRHDKGQTIFVGSGIDMWAREIHATWKWKTLKYCNKFPENQYLYQTKNPADFMFFIYENLFPPDTILGTTIESDIDYPDMGFAPPVRQRKYFINLRSFKTMVSIEPILDFNLETMVKWMADIAPLYISIGADSQGHKLPEPPPEKIKKLIEELRKFTEVKIKQNLDRLLKR